MISAIVDGVVLADPGTVVTSNVVDGAEGGAFEAPRTVVGGAVGGGTVVGNAIVVGGGTVITSPGTAVGMAPAPSRVVGGSEDTGLGTVTVTITVTVGMGPGIVVGMLGLVPGTCTMMTCGAAVVTGPVLSAVSGSVVTAVATSVATTSVDAGFDERPRVDISAAVIVAAPMMTAPMIGAIFERLHSEAGASFFRDPLRLPVAGPPGIDCGLSGGPA